MNQVNVVLLVCQSAGEVVLDVGIHDRSEVVETTVPEQVNDKHLSTQTHRSHNYFLCLKVTLNNSAYEFTCVLLTVLPETGKPEVHIYQCCHLKDRRACPGHLARTVRGKTRTNLKTTITLKTLQPK